jgi:hypothetical protein
MARFETAEIQKLLEDTRYTYPLYTRDLSDILTARRKAAAT